MPKSDFLGKSDFTHPTPPSLPPSFDDEEGLQGNDASQPTDYFFFSSLGG
ncbi:MAG: hypothetical protein HYW65_03365 [Candidatus Liptonbacteria bacterium]|nr:hypothetical protein [Candidatus Liptonbacteria bacterium]